MSAYPNQNNMLLRAMSVSAMLIQKADQMESMKSSVVNLNQNLYCRAYELLADKALWFCDLVDTVKNKCIDEIRWDELSPDWFLTDTYESDFFGQEDLQPLQELILCHPRFIEILSIRNSGNGIYYDFFSTEELVDLQALTDELSEYLLPDINDIEADIDDIADIADH